MADEKITQLVEDTAPASTDVTITTDDTIGTPVSKKSTWANILASIQSLITGLGTVTSGDVSAILDAASTSVVGVAEIATAAEINTGTDDTRTISPLGLASSNRDPLGKQTIWIPASAMIATTTSGCALITQVELTAGQPELNTLDFDATSDEHAQFSIAFPKKWNEGTVTFQVFWTSTAADTDGVAWGLQGVALTDGDAHETAYGTPIVVTDDAQGTANDVYVTGESSAITIAGTPAADDLCYFRIFRDVSDANDDMTEDAKLIGIKLFYTIDAANDD